MAKGIYNRETGRFDAYMSPYLDNVEKRVQAIFDELCDNGYAPADAALLIVEAASNARMDRVLATPSNTKEPDHAEPELP